MFVAALAAYGVGLGVVDAAGNMQAVAVEHAAGRPLLPSFHGAWTFGGLLGAGLTLAVPGLGPAAAVTVVPLLAAGAPLLPRSAQGQQHEAVRSDVEIPWRQIVLVGLGMVVFYMVDTAATTWGPTYLDLAFATPDRAVALATFPYLLATLVMRLAGDGLVARIGPVPVLRVGGVVAAGALVVVVLAPTWVVAVVGFTVLGAGVAVIAPLSYSAAARIAGGTEVPAHLRRARVDAVIGRFNQFNYVGALLGAVLTGLVGAHDLRFGSQCRWCWCWRSCRWPERSAEPEHSLWPGPTDGLGSARHQHPDVEVEQHPVGVLAVLLAQRHRLVTALGGHQAQSQRSHTGR